MGAWGPGVFSNDTAADARCAWRDALIAGEDPASASSRIVRQFGGSAADADFWTGLAAAQQETGHLQDDVRDRALAVVAGGADLDLWEEAGQRAARERVLQRLAAKLRGPQPAPKRLRRARVRPDDMEVPDPRAAFAAQQESARRHGAMQPFATENIRRALDQAALEDLSPAETELLSELRSAAEMMRADYDDGADAG